MKLKRYILTDQVGTHFLGKRVRSEDRKEPIELTDSQAEHELRIGNVELYVEKKLAPAPRKD